MKLGYNHKRTSSSLLCKQQHVVGNGLEVAGGLLLGVVGVVVANRERRGVLPALQPDSPVKLLASAVITASE